MNDAASAGGVFGLIQLAVLVLMVVSLWKIFVKAGQPGWACLVPIYNAYILLKIAGTVLGLIFLPIIFYPILAFGDAAYVGNPA